MSALDISDIHKYLPHRYPFLLVDRVVELNAGENITAFKNLSVNEEFFNGHFPGNPVFPGVLLLEAMAQAAGILGFVTAGKAIADGSTFYFAGADQLRFKRPKPVTSYSARFTPRAPLRRSAVSSICFLKRCMVRYAVRSRSI